ncbi:NAD(P)H-binding protein [Haloarcula nitratireducens]|uniref:NAD(P)H-binding protein n=1 Tax=Haloarcula nitratireducens TaxID=2487749 RepID=A0AAW4PJP1_9EURY|nr:NAD(P)H-binding protein [Halomicroarcula nitratireducens]MBX0298186.1 NAD(P)H-binding protein [Halomicroarcula nitratireducens]
MRILVTGATGFIGTRLIPILKARNHDVAVLTRDADGYDGAADIVYEGDVLDAGSFEQALTDVDAAYYLIHSMGSGDDFAEKDRRAARNFREAADEADIERAVYLSGLGEDDDDLSKHLQSRREVERILADGEFALTVLRAAIIIGDGNDSFQIVTQLAKRLPMMITPRWIRNDCQPVAVDDVIAYLVGVIEIPKTAGSTYDIGGPEAFSYEEFLHRTADVAGRPSAIIPVPVLTSRLSTYWVKLVTDVPNDIIQPLVHGLKNEVTADDDSIRKHLPITLSSHDSAIQRALDGDGSEPAEKRVLSKLDAITTSTH